MKIVIVAFTRAGSLLASRLADGLSEPESNARVFVPERYAGEGREVLAGTVGEWASFWFNKNEKKAEALVFISAVGIAVRAIAPFLHDKTTDPAVVVLDDKGKNVISLLSGHIGGGNALTQKIAALIGAYPVVTTATDIHGIEAADEWAVNNNCAIENISAVKHVSAAMLDGLPVGVAITEERLSPPWPVTLWLRPRVLVLGVGCRRGIPKEALDVAVEDFLKGAGVSVLSMRAVASIELKRDEPALLEFSSQHGIPFLTYTAEELRMTEGRFTSSEKVREVTGVDNVCERAAVLASSGVLLRSKTLYPGIAMALAKISVD